MANHRARAEAIPTGGGWRDFLHGRVVRLAGGLLHYAARRGTSAASRNNHSKPALNAGREDTEPFTMSDASSNGHKLGTQCLHAGQQADPTTNSRAVPIYATTSYVVQLHGSRGESLRHCKEFGNIYSRLMNPTVDVLEQRLAAMEGGVGSALFRLRASGDHREHCARSAHAGQNLVSATSLYGGTWTLFTHHAVQEHRHRGAILRSRQARDDRRAGRPKHASRLHGIDRQSRRTTCPTSRPSPTPPTPPPTARSR